MEEEKLYLVKMSCFVLFCFVFGPINLLPADIFKKIINVITTGLNEYSLLFLALSIIPSNVAIELSANTSELLKTTY